VCVRQCPRNTLLSQSRSLRVCHYPVAGFLACHSLIVHLGRRSERHQSGEKLHEIRQSPNHSATRHSGRSWLSALLYYIVHRWFRILPAYALVCVKHAIMRCTHSTPPLVTGAHALRALPESFPSPAVTSPSPCADCRPFCFTLSYFRSWETVLSGTLLRRLFVHVAPGGGRTSCSFQRSILQTAH
jgi:hypothetical protein